MKVERERLNNMTAGYAEAVRLLRMILESDARGQGVQYAEALNYAKAFLVQEGVHVAD